MKQQVNWIVEGGDAYRRSLKAPYYQKSVEVWLTIKAAVHGCQPDEALFREGWKEAETHEKQPKTR